MIQVLERAFDILELLSREPDREFSSSRIAEALGLSSTTCNNILRTMVLRNYLEQDGLRSGYRLGPMAHRVGHSIDYQDHLIRMVKPYAEEFTARTNESCNLVILRNCHRFVLSSVHCSHQIHARNEICPDGNLYVSATARTLMAYADEATLKKIIKRYGEPTREVWPEAAGKLQAELARIRERGYGLANEAVPNIAGGAVPIFCKEKVVAVLGYWLPTLRHSHKVEQGLIAALKEACNDISSRLG